MFLYRKKQIATQTYFHRSMLLSVFCFFTFLLFFKLLVCVCVCVYSHKAYSFYFHMFFSSFDFTFLYYFVPFALFFSSYCYLYIGDILSYSINGFIVYIHFCSFSFSCLPVSSYLLYIIFFYLTIIFFPCN